MDLFSRYMSGRLVLVEGQWMINADWGAVVDEDGKPKFIGDTNEIVYAWQNPIPLHEYTCLFIHI